MNVRLYANTSSLALTERLEGGSFQPPVLAAYSDIHLRFKLSELMAGTAIPDKRGLVSLSARIGRPDAPPVSGAYQLAITLGATTMTTAAIANDAAPLAIQGALDAVLTGALAALNPCAVSSYEGLQRIVFADKTQRPQIACEENSLWPDSFVDIDEIEFAEGWAYVLQLRQAPVAEVEVFSQEVPAAPAITRLQGGSEIDGLALNEVQKLAIAPSFSGGSFRIVRSGVKSPPLVVPTDIAKLRSALAVLADEGGSFVVTEVNNGIYIEFTGSMAGQGHDLMTVEVFESPGPDYFFTLPTRTDGMRTLMRGADETGQLEVPLNISLEIYDPVTATTQEVTIVQLLRFTRPVATGEHNVAASLVWNQPLSRADYLRHSTDALLIGNRSITKVIGDGTAKSFAINHNLLEIANPVTASAATDAFTAVDHGYANGDPVNFANSGGALPAPLVAGVTYWILAAATDTFKVSSAPGGAALDLATNGTGTSTVVLADGTAADAVFVQVWETGGTREMIPSSAYTVARTSNNAVAVTFSAAPAVGKYQVIVLTAGRPATYQAHHHEIDETPEAKLRIEALEARVAALEAGNFGGGTAPAISTMTGKIDRPLPRVWTIPRTRALPIDPGNLFGWNPFGEGSTLRDIRLLPAVHLDESAIEALPTLLPAPSLDYRDRVFYSAIDRDDIVGGMKVGQFAACDGREWYRVVREVDSLRSWYPAIMGVELFRLSISPDELALRTRLDLALGIEMALFDPSRRPSERRTVGRMRLLLERGVRTVASGSGANIIEHFADPVILARHDFDLTAVPMQKHVSLSIARSGSDVITAHAGLFLGSPTVVSAPETADFSLRLRIAGVDFEDLPVDGRGVFALRGPDIGLDGQADNNLGRWKIS